MKREVAVELRQFFVDGRTVGIEWRQKEYTDGLKWGPWRKVIVNPGDVVTIGWFTDDDRDLDVRGDRFHQIIGEGGGK